MPEGRKGGVKEEGKEPTGTGQPPWGNPTGSIPDTCRRIAKGEEAGYVYCSAMSWEDSVRGRGLSAPRGSGDGKAYKFGRERTILAHFCPCSDIGTAAPSVPGPQCQCRNPVSAEALCGAPSFLHGRLLSCLCSYNVLYPKYYKNRFLHIRILQLMTSRQTPSRRVPQQFYVRYTDTYQPSDSVAQR